MRLKIRPYKMGSRGAKKLGRALTEALGRRVLLSRNPRFLRGRAVINWGSQEPVVFRRLLGNTPPSVANCIQKIKTLRLLGDLGPEHTNDRAIAARWIEEGSVVYCRTLTTSREGRGIVLADRQDRLVGAPLYTKRFKASREYRVHVCNGEVIQLVQKRKRAGAENANPLIRANRDWVFARNFSDKTTPEEIERVKAIALQGAQRLGVTFGAFDILYSVKQGKACILECNSAPGLDDTSARLYAQAFKRGLEAS